MKNTITICPLEKLFLKNHPSLLCLITAFKIKSQTYQPIPLIKYARLQNLSEGISIAAQKSKEKNRLTGTRQY